MKFLIVLAVVVACVVAAPPQSGADRDAQVLGEQSEINPDGTWSNSLQTSNGIQQTQAGQLKQVQGAESPSISVSGSYIQIGENGEQLEVRYVADENGFQPQGAHLPTPPPQQ